MVGEMEETTEQWGHLGVGISHESAIPFFPPWEQGATSRPVLLNLQLFIHIKGEKGNAREMAMGEAIGDDGST